MTKDLTVSEVDLIEFFGSDFTSREFGSEWYDSDSVYEYSENERLKVTCAIHPVHKDSRITLQESGECIFDWNATALSDIFYDRKEQTLTFITQNEDKLYLKLQPRISVKYDCKFLHE